MASEFLKHTSKQSSLHPSLTGLVPRQRLQDCTSAEGVKGCSSIDWRIIFSRDLTQSFWCNEGLQSRREPSCGKLNLSDGVWWGTNEVTCKMQLTCTIRLQPCGPVAYRKHGACRMWQLSATSNVLVETFAPWSISNSLPLDWVFPHISTSLMETLWKNNQKQPSFEEMSGLTARRPDAFGFLECKGHHLCQLARLLRWHPPGHLELFGQLPMGGGHHNGWFLCFFL